jgi:co-chaperonin GroES (HSP10)
MEAKVLKVNYVEYIRAPYMGKNASGYNPIGDHVLVRPDIAAQKTTGGIELTEDQVERHQMSAQTGTVIACGDGAFLWSADRTRPFEGYKPRPGDHVAFARYAGQVITGKDNVHYRLMEDKAIGGVEGKQA